MIRNRRLVVGGLWLALLAGCGSETAPASSNPAGGSAGSSGSASGARSAGGQANLGGTAGGGAGGILGGGAGIGGSSGAAGVGGGIGGSPGGGQGGAAGGPATACHGDEATVCDHFGYVDPNQSGADPNVPVTRLVVVGDSISRGQVAPDGEAYFNHLHRELESRYGAGAVELVGNALGQSTTGTLIERCLEGTAPNATPLESLVDGGFPAVGHTVVVMSIGGDDVNHGVAEGATNADFLGPRLSDARANLGAIVDWLRGSESAGSSRRFVDGVSIYVMNVFDPTDGTYQTSGAPCSARPYMPVLENLFDTWREGYNSEAAARASQGSGFSVIDALGHFRGHGHSHDDPSNPYYRQADPSGWFTTNCTHPGQVGHRELARLFWEAMDSGHGDQTAAP